MNCGQKETNMKRQKSFDEKKPSVYLVPTPIGNRQEMSPRALEILKEVDMIACEDTRNTGQLLKYFGIKKPLISHHEHNQEESIQKILDYLSQGKTIGIVSDAGYPLISDPGAALVRVCIENDFPVISISGANAALNALVASGLDPKHYLFYGFLETKSSKRKEQLKELDSFPYTLIFYEAPHRIDSMLKDLLEIFGDRKICLARELTKLYEEYLRGTISEILPVVSSLKGEMVVVVEGAKTIKKEVSLEEAAQLVYHEIDKGLSTKQSVQQIAQKLGISKNELYQYVVKMKRVG